MLLLVEWSAVAPEDLYLMMQQYSTVQYSTVVPLFHLGDSSVLCVVGGRFVLFLCGWTFLGEYLRLPVCELHCHEQVLWTIVT
jgi:hypothetical protein